MLGFRHYAVVAAPLLASCGEDTYDPGESEADSGSAVVSSGGPPVAGQACDGTQFGCLGFCYTEQQCGPGVCLASPIACTGACDGVCGCDGAFYCNACVAHQNSIDVAMGATCTPPPPADFVNALGPSPLRISLLEYDPGADVCLQIMLIANEPGLPYDATVSAPWSIESAFATHRALDCNVVAGCIPVAPMGELAEPAAVEGEILIDEGDLPDGVLWNLTLTFEGFDWIDQRTVSLPAQIPSTCF